MKTHRPDAGFSLAAIVFFATVTSIFIAAAVPVYQMQAKRELEEELIFRGGEYTRAIQKYRTKFGTYPTSIDQLVSTNGLRFIRRPYKDPVTGKDFRLITINPDGSLNGSKIFQQNMNTTQSLFGNTTPAANSTPGPQPSGSTSPTQTQSPQQPGGFGVGGGTSSSGGSFGTPLGGVQNQQQPGGFGVGGGTSSPGGSFGTPLGGLQSLQPQQTQQPQQPQQTQQGFPSSGSSSSPLSSASSPFGNSSGAFGSQSVTSGGIVGVASDSDKASIKIYNNRQKYNEWEFVALLNQQGQAGQVGQPGLPGQVSQPGQAGQTGQNPFQTPPVGGTSVSPFGTGGTPTQNPFGTGIPTQNPISPGQGMPTQNPFGTPTTPTTPGSK